MQKDSIKREQSQAGLSFAERKNFRPQVKNKVFLLLALLMTAATGAWADNTVTWEGATLKSVNVASYENNKTQTIGDITVTANSGYFKDFGSGNNGVIASAYETNGLVFSANAKFKSVEVTASSSSTFNHTSGSATSHTYTVNPTATSFALPYGDGWINITKIVFTFEDAAAAPSSGYTVSMKSGTQDADKWTVKVGEGQAQALPIGGLKGDGSETVTLQYNGRLKVKGVKATSDAAPAANSVDLSKLTENTELKDGDVLTGTLGANVKISIADGATVTLDGVTINGVNDSNYDWAGITCLGDATIILSGTNTVKGFYQDYPGIQAAAGKTLIINGTGSLTASSYGWGAGIGGGSGSGAACGNIEIQGGTINATSVEYGAGIGGGNNSSWGNITISGGTVTATGGWRGAGIGGGRKSSNGSVSCGNILISGGTITATGGEDAAGIGGGRGYNVNYKSSCGTITITSGVTEVTATKGENASNSIGAGNVGTCGTITIGGDATTYAAGVTTSPFTYTPSN